MEEVATPSPSQNIDIEKAFEFAAGVFGFPAEKRYAIVEVPGGGDVIKQMTSLEKADLGFTIVYPFAFFADYAPEIPDDEIREIGAEGPDQVVLMVIANVPNEFKQATVNLKAPLVFNPFTQKARQVILADEKYLTRQPLFKA